MIKTENASDDVISFAHSFRIPVVEVKHMMPKQFVTAYRCQLINWHIQISESGGIPAFIRNIIEPDGQRESSVYQITLHPAGQRERHPPVQKVEFKMRIMDIQERDTLSPIRFVHPPGFPTRNVFNAGYSTPERGPIRDLLNAIVGNRQFDNMIFEIHTLIVFNVDDFLNMNYLNRSIGKPMPLDLNFRYNLLMNSATHDFKLLTTSQLEFPCNKEALFVASPFFRKNLTSEMTSFQMNVELLEAIEVTITWMLTETYHPPSKMTPELAEEIVTLADRIVPRGPNQRQLLGSIERHCYEELIKNHEDMQYVKHLLLVAHNNRLGSLLESCHATIITFHFADFCRQLKENPDAAFTQQAQMTRTSAMSRLNENYARSLFVKSFTRKLIPPSPLPQN